MAARQKSGVGSHGSIRFVGDPSLDFVFGARTKGAFDSERGLLEYTLRFVNSEESPVEPDAAQVAARPLLQPDVLAGVRKDYRASLRQFVSKFRSNRSAALRLVPEHLLVLRNIVMTPRWEATGAHLEFWLLVESPDALRTVFLLMIADDSRPFGRALCQCRLKECRRFFLEQKPATGRPQRLYCSREHMLAAHAARER